MAKRRATAKLRPGHALWATKLFAQHEKLVYVIIADKRLTYPKGKSRIAYIGTTGSGSTRIAASAAQRGQKLLGKHGIREFTVRIISCKLRTHVALARKLERALLYTFLQLYGRVPECNHPKTVKQRGDSFKYFHERGMRDKIEELS